MEGHGEVVLIDDLGGDLLARDLVEERDGAGVRLRLQLLGGRLVIDRWCVDDGDRFGECGDGGDLGFG